jgi:hypothetical protein
LLTAQPSSYNTGNNSFFGSQSQASGYQQPSVTSPLPTPPAYGLPPHHPSAIMSPAETPQPRMPSAIGGPSNADRTSSLLNLLKFSQPATSSTNQAAPIGTPLPSSREPSASYASPDAQPRVNASLAYGNSELLAALMGTSQPKPTPQAPQAMADAPVRSSFGTEPTSPPLIPKLIFFNC